MARPPMDRLEPFDTPAIQHDFCTSPQALAHHTPSLGLRTPLPLQSGTCVLVMIIEVVSFDLLRLGGAGSQRDSCEGIHEMLNRNPARGGQGRHADRRHWEK